MLSSLRLRVIVKKVSYWQIWTFARLRSQLHEYYLNVMYCKIVRKFLDLNLVVDRITKVSQFILVMRLSLDILSFCKRYNYVN